MQCGLHAFSTTSEYVFLVIGRTSWMSFSVQRNLCDFDIFLYAPDPAFLGASAACPSPCIGHRGLGSLEKARPDWDMPGMMPKAVGWAVKGRRAVSLQTNRLERETHAWPAGYLLSTQPKDHVLWDLWACTAQPAMVGQIQLFVS